MCELKYLISITPLGHLYGSAGGFLSPENLVGRSREKFPPDASTLAGLMLNATENPIAKDLYVIGGFWAGDRQYPYDFYVPMPWTKIIAEDGWNEWVIDDQNQWQKQEKNDHESEYTWLNISGWDQSASEIYVNKNAAKSPWKYLPILHPKMKKQERHTLDENGLFLEQAVQLEEDVCLVYFSSHSVEDGWYRFGGENHLVELQCFDIEKQGWDSATELFNQKIKQTFALITSGIWGSNRFSRRYPDPAQTKFPEPTQKDFPKPTHILTDKPIPLRSRSGGVLQRGRYGVPAGSVYVLPESLDQSWCEWSKSWFPTSGYSLKQVGYGVALPLTIQGV